MRLDDAQIERYSRQLILSEIGPKGQATLAASRVAIATTGPAAERAVAYLAAAGVGSLTLPPALVRLVDPAQPDVALEAWPAVPDARFDAALIGPGDTARAEHAFWIENGRAAEVPPCTACAAAALGPAGEVASLLLPVRDAILGTIVATEIVKALLHLGVGLRGHVLTYDPSSATFTTVPVASRPPCACTRAAGREPPGSG